MSVSLQKGQRVDLTKGNAGLQKIVIGLGWDELEGAKGKGALGSFFGGAKKQAIDCDASVITASQSAPIDKNDKIIYFGNLANPNGSIKHMGDNLTGAGDGDDEQIVVNLAAIPAHIEKLVFVVNIYDAHKRNQHFGMIKNAFIRIVDEAKKEELCRYNLSENYDNMTAMVFGEIYRNGSEWKFNAIGAATTDGGLGEMVNRF